MSFKNYNAPISPMYATNNGFGAQQPYQPTFSGLPPKQGFQNMPYAVPLQQQNGIKTNMVFVTSLEDAYQRETYPNAQMIYLDQDKPFLYVVFTDSYGRKTSETYELVKNENRPIENQQVDFVSKEEFIKYQKQTNETIDKLRRIIALEPTPSSVPINTEEVTSNG